MSGQDQTESSLCLPVELGLRQAIAIYVRRLLIFGAVIGANAILGGLIFLLFQSPLLLVLVVATLALFWLTLLVWLIHGHLGEEAKSVLRVLMRHRIADPESHREAND
jgi:hypothetical protein